jgi:histidinol-phosphatase (PHP family)
VSSRSNWFDYYFEDLEKAKATYARKGLNVKFGVEVDYQRAVEDEVKRILSERHFDFVLGAVHSIDHVSISLEDEALICFREKSAREVCEKYYLEMESAVKSGLFDVVAHLDIYRKYGADFIDKDTQSVCVDHAERVFDLMVEKNVGLEINTSAFRRGEDEPFPSIELLERWKSRNQEVVTVGSDAHSTADLGTYIDKGIAIAKKLGLKVCTFKDREVEKCF